MNETDFIRQQLATERTHLRELLAGVRRGAGQPAVARAVTTYMEWASPRLVAELEAHRAVLAEATDVPRETRLQLEQLAAALKNANATDPQPPAARAAQLQGLLDAWNESLEDLAAGTLRTVHWRRAAHLSADSILEERQLYLAARSAAHTP